MTLADEQIVETPPQNDENHTHSKSETQPIDHDHLAKYTMGDSDLEREILQLFVDQLPMLVSELRAASTEKDWHVAAHTLKGSARAVGAHCLGDLAEAAEKVGPDWSSFDLRPLQDNSEIVKSYVATLAA